MVDKERPLSVGVFDDDQDDAATLRPGAGAIRQLMGPEVLARRAGGRTLEEGLRETLQGLVGAEPADIGEAFRLQRVQEVRRREAGVGAEPDRGDETTEPAQQEKREVETPIGRVNVALAEAGAEEVAAVDAGDERMEAGDPIMPVVSGARLLAVNGMGERVEIEGDLFAAGVQRGEDEPADDFRQAPEVALPGERL
jgi:hypothetical protein